MASGCGGCGGSGCNCLVLAGNGVSVTGTGTSADPFIVGVDVRSIGLSTSIAAASSSTIELAKTGSGAAGDPIVLVGDVVIQSPNGTRWSLAVSDAGALSVVAAAPRRGGVGDPGIALVQAGADYYWDGSAWTTQPQDRYWSLGFTGVPVPPNYRKGSTWVREAT